MTSQKTFSSSSFLLHVFMCLGIAEFATGQAASEVYIVESDLVATEGDPGDPARFTLVRTGSTYSSLEVNLEINGSAAPELDYSLISSSVTIPAGRATQQIIVNAQADNVAEGDELITVSVQPSPDYTLGIPVSTSIIIRDAPFDAWRFSKFTSVQLADPEISGLVADPDDDGNPNLGEFFAGSNPLWFDQGLAFRIEQDGEQHLLKIRRNPSAAALSLLIEESDDLVDWKATVPQPATSLDTHGEWDSLTFPIASGDPAKTQGFWRGSIRQVSPAESEVYEYHLDSVNGNDFNDGLSPETAFQTFEALAPILSTNRAASVGLARGSRFSPLVTIQRDLTGRWGAYGIGEAPFIDGSLPVDPMQINPHASHSNVYVVEITHTVPPFYTGSTSASFVVANGPHVGMWWETEFTGMFGEYLEPVFGLADTSTSEQFVADNPGRVFVQKVGSSLTDVRYEASGATLRYTFQLHDSSDPRVAGSLRYACFHSAGLTFGTGAVVKNISFGRQTRKDLLGTVNNGSQPVGNLPVFEGCAWLDSGCHALVGPSHWRMCLAYSRTPGSRLAGGGWHNYTSVYEPRVPTIYDSRIRGHANPIYSHGSVQSPVLNKLQGARIIIDQASTAFALPSTSQPSEFSDIIVRGARILTDRNVVLRRFSASIATTTNSTGIFANGPCGIVEDGVIFYEPSAMSASNRAVAAANNNSQAASEALGTPTIRRVTFANSPLTMALQTSFQKHIDFVIEDSVVGRTVLNNDPASGRFISDALITNSYVGPLKSGNLPLFPNLAAYQIVVPGAADDTILYDGNKPVTFAGDPLVDPTITGPAEILGQGIGVAPAIILELPSKLANVPTLQSMGFAP